MSTLIIVFTIVFMAFLAMSIGMLFGKKPISGSCGGIANLDSGSQCEICGDNPNKCLENT
tara:strand:+ start:18131 stop:18310 length:180 start_codon:yes stop_codon:yes gene_type:complete